MTTSTCKCSVRVLLYDTPDCYIILGRLDNNLFRILKVNRKDPTTLLVEADDTLFTSSAVETMLFNHADQIHCSHEAFALFGFVQLANEYFIILVTQTHSVASLLKRPIYQVDDIEVFPLCSVPKLSAEQAKYLALLQLFDVQSLYFSPHFDLTNTLQNTLSRQQPSSNQSINHNQSRDDFCYNFSFLQTSSLPACWKLPFIHGHVIERTLHVSSCSVSFTMTLISRRSRHYAGTRYCKRGLTTNGNAANFVEVELVVACDSKVQSFVLCRGSVPLLWSQSINKLTLNPRIQLNQIDSNYSQTRYHLSDLIFKYSTPIICVNLLSNRGKEAAISREYKKAIEFINKSCKPKHLDNVLSYLSIDLKHLLRSNSHDTELSEAILCPVALKIIKETGFFSAHYQLGHVSIRRYQSGVPRVNCIDSSDRTGAVQTFVMLSAVSLMLQEIQLLPPNQFISHNSFVGKELVRLSNITNNALCQQYSGSFALNKAKLMNVSSENSFGREIFINMKRYVSNRYFDSSKQMSYNFITKWNSSIKVNLWDLASDVCLHNPPPSTWKRYSDDVGDYSWLEIPLKGKRYSKTYPFEQFKPVSFHYCNLCSDFNVNFLSCIHNPDSLNNYVSIIPLLEKTCSLTESLTKEVSNEEADADSDDDGESMEFEQDYFKSDQEIIDQVLRDFES
ncbi:hypothetical protein P9112_002875 [Eukaryota sp. TZLM1-RC]